MQHVTIIPSANQVSVDGVSLSVDCSKVDPTIHAIQWSVTAGIGEIEFINDPYAPPASYKAPQQITTIAPCQSLIDAWTAANTAANAPPPPPTLAQVQAAKVAALRMDCASQIMAGASSSALGVAHTYPTDPTSQLNLAGSVTASLLPNLTAGWTTPFWCADASGNWVFAAHTPAQIQQVGQDVKTAVVVAQTKLAQLTAQVNAAPDAATVTSITW